MSGKRANIFGQGKPEQPYEERDGPAEVPQRATAAQLATRKIKTAKLRRPAGGASTPSQSANFGTSQSGFTFGASAPAVGGNNSTNGMFGGNNAFSGGSTNSFPPAQSAAPSNSFSSSSFPAFGTSSQGTGFNPQPPSATNFNFISGNSNPFQSNGASSMNGSGAAPTFGGGSVFSSQAPGNPFAGLTQNNTTSAAGTDSLFGTSSSAPSTNMFSTANTTSNAPSTSTPAYSFGATSSSVQNTASMPATSNTFSGFGGSTQNTAAPAQNSIFSGFGTNGQNGAAAEHKTPQKSLFSTSTAAQSTGNAMATAPSTSLFNFGSNAQQNTSTTTTTTAPSSNMFGTSGTPSSAPANNPFALLPTSSASPAPAFSFGQQTSQAQEKATSAAGNPFGGIKLPEQNAETPKPSLFSSVKPPEPSASAPSDTPKPGLFASLAKPPPAAHTPGSIFRAPQNKDGASEASEKPGMFTASTATEAPKPSLFSGFSTPQPAKPAEAEKPKVGLFSAQPKTNSGIFTQTFQPENHNTGNAFTAPSTFSAFKLQSASSAAAPPKDTTAQTTTSAEPSNPFSKLLSTSSESPNLFTPSKQQDPAPAPAAMPTFTGATSSSTDTTNGPELPKVPKAHVPKEWIATSVSGTQNGDSLYNLISNLTMQIQQLNEKYRAKITNLSPSADWSALSLWHHQHSSAIKKKIDIAKKQRAAAKGVTGNESALSTKRKVNEESSENRDASPSKRARPANAPAIPTPQPATPTPKLNPPPATATSNMFSKAINNKPSAPTETTNLFAQKPVEKSASDPPKFATPITGLQPSLSAFNGATASQSPFLASGFRPSASTTTSAGFKPSATGGSGGFASQFAAKAKTYEELAAERKKKAMEEDYDSDEETKEQWSAKYDKQEAERIAKEKAATAAVTGFSLPTPTPAKASGASTPASNPFANLAKPASGSSTPGLFTPRPASPALSMSGSVFDNPSTAQSPSSNIFGHLSSGASSNNQEESEEDDNEQASHDPTESTYRPTTPTYRPTTPPKRNYGDADTEADDSLDETQRKKQDTAPKTGSLLSRMTRADDDGSGSEKENNGSNSVFGKINGTQTPTNKPFSFFDFGAAGANTAPPKPSDTFAGDQTFKPGTPIKFGDGAATEKKAVPTFQFQPASTSTTPSKPPPTSLFNFGSTASGSSLLAPNAGLSGLSSAPSSAFSSRAATPLSEADTSAASGAEDDEEGGKHEQVDLSKLTEEELTAFDVVFETEQALAKHQVDKGDGTKAWENFARGPLYILKDKVTGKRFVRIRTPSGQTPLNYSILPALKSNIMGSSGKMVQGSKPKKDGGIEQYYISLKTPEIAKEFSEKYNESLP